MSRKPTSKALSRLRQTYKAQGRVLLPLIERHVMRKAVDESRRMDVLHPSEMAKSDWCGRHDYYRITGDHPPEVPKNPSFRLGNVFSWGHGVHAKYQRWLQEMGVLWGLWKCRACKTTWEGLDGLVCPSCGTDDVEYQEVPVVAVDLLIDGRADGVVILTLEDGSRRAFVIEIKTVGVGTVRFAAPNLYRIYTEDQLTSDELWFRINRPFAGHVRQAMLYLHVLRRTMPELEEIVFIYEWKPTQDVKEFVVKYQPELASTLEEAARTVADGVETGVPPERPSWAKGPDAAVCASCTYRGPCWGEETTDDQEDPTPATPVVVAKRATARRRRAALQP